MRVGSPWQRRRNRGRQGTAVVELAVCLPVMALLIFASIEGANMLFLRQAAVQSAYEAAKAAARSNGGQALGLQRAQQVLAARNINGSTINFNPGNVDGLDAGTPFTVTVTVPGTARSITGFGPFNGVNIQTQATMAKE